MEQFKNSYCRLASFTEGDSLYILEVDIGAEENIPKWKFWRKPTSHVLRGHYARLKSDTHWVNLRNQAEASEELTTLLEQVLRSARIHNIMRESQGRTLTP